jgi:hypothetical protein
MENHNFHRYIIYKWVIYVIFQFAMLVITRGYFQNPNGFQVSVKDDYEFCDLATKANPLEGNGGAWCNGTLQGACAQMCRGLVIKNV